MSDTRVTRRAAIAPLAAALAVSAWACAPLVGAALSLAVPAAATAAERAAPTPPRARPRVVVRREAFVRPAYRTNHVPGVWRGEVRMPWVGPGICHDGRSSGRVYCILW